MRALLILCLFCILLFSEAQSCLRYREKSPLYSHEWGPDGNLIPYQWTHFVHAQKQCMVESQQLIWTFGPAPAIFFCKSALLHAGGSGQEKGLRFGVHCHHKSHPSHGPNLPSLLISLSFWSPWTCSIPCTKLTCNGQPPDNHQHMWEDSDLPARAQTACDATKHFTTVVQLALAEEKNDSIRSKVVVLNFLSQTALFP